MRIIRLRLGEKYSIPGINIPEALNDLLNGQDEASKELRESVKEKLEQEHERLLKEAQDTLEKARKKIKTLPDVDPSTIKPRLDPETLCELMIWRFKKGDAQNRGFVLDGYPKTLADCNLFFARYEQEFNSSLQMIVLLESSDEHIRTYLRALNAQNTPDQKPAHHHTEEHFNRRFELFKCNFQGVSPALGSKTNAKEVPQVDAEGKKIPASAIEFLEETKAELIRVNLEGFDGPEAAAESIGQEIEQRVQRRTLRSNSAMIREVEQLIQIEESQRKEEKLRKAQKESEEKAIQEKIEKEKERDAAALKKLQENEKKELAKRNLPVL